MVRQQNNRPSDFVLINRTQDFFLESLQGKVTDPKLLGAWREFHKLYDPVIRRYVMSCGMQGEFLEDVVQTAWALVIRELQRFDCDPRKGSFRAWLFARARNVTVSQVREIERSREHCVGVDFAGQVSCDLEPAELFERQWDELILHDALRVLERYVSDFDYKLFVMRRFHELSVAELVDDTGVAEATIRSKLHRTMTTFRKLIDVQGYRDLMFQCD